MKIKLFNLTRRCLVLSLVLAILCTSTSLANQASPSNATLSENTPDNLDYTASITYNGETGEITYGMDQNCAEIASFALDNLDTDSSKEFEQISPAYIIDRDSRQRVSNTLDSPYRNICLIDVQYPDGTLHRGSGTLVYFDVVLTAGHILYSHEHGSWATSLAVYPAMQGDNYRPLGSSGFTLLTSNNAWINNKDYNYDWGIVDLKNSFDTWQLFGYYQDYTKQENKPITTIGYPRDKLREMYYDNTGTVLKSEETVQGDSGGAVINNENGILIGIISYEMSKWWGIQKYNGAVRLNEDLCNRIKAHWN